MIVLDEAQAFTLKGHGRNHVFCVFIEFIPSSIYIKKWISSFIANRITTLSQQLEDNRKYRSKEMEHIDYMGNLLFSFLLSGTGYKILDEQGFYHADRKPDTFGIVPPKNEHGPSDDTIFQRDQWQSSIRERINDKELKYWEKNYQNNLDALIILADDNEKRIRRTVEEIEISLSGVGRILFIEVGDRIIERKGKTNKKVSLEPFGYQDGLTKFNFFDKNGNPNCMSCGSCEFCKRWEIALDSYGGSYLVFRKLEQNVELFAKKVELLSKELNISISETEAQLMGRFKNGTPLQFSSKDTFKNDSLVSNFNDLESTTDFHVEDIKGHKCPFHSHVRRLNPRKPKQNQSKIIRRSIPYRKEGKTGLLFMCYQRNINKQFMQLQEYSNSKEPSYPDKERNGLHFLKGLDPIAGQPATLDNELQYSQKWNKKWNSNRKANKVENYFDFSDTVTFKGGGFFYAPPISYLEDIGKNKHPSNLSLVTLEILANLESIQSL